MNGIVKSRCSRFERFSTIFSQVVVFERNVYIAK